jgi:AcrR family transcriptional regulator
MSRFSRRNRRASILHAARKALARRGFLGTRAEDIARAAGVSAGLLFRYFPTLADLQRAVIGQGLELPSMVWPKNLSGMRPRTACKAVAAAFREAVDRDPDALRLAYFGALTEVPDSALFVRRDLLRVERRLGSILRAWKAKKWVVSEVDATGLSRMIVSALVQDAVSGQLFGIRNGGRRRDRMMDAIAGLLEGSVRAVVRDPSRARWRAG